MYRKQRMSFVINVRVFSHLCSWLHENGCIQHAVPFVCNVHITFYETSSSNLCSHSCMWSNEPSSYQLQLHSCRAAVRLVWQEMVLLLCVCCSGRRQCTVQHEVYEAEKYLCIYNYKLLEYSKTDANDNIREKVAKQFQDTGMYYLYLFIIVSTGNHIIKIEVHV